MADDDLADGSFHIVTAGGWQILLARVGYVVRAINNRCSHAASSFDGGRLRGATITCPQHGARFDMATGKCAGAAYPAIRTFAVDVQAGRIRVHIPDRLPGNGEAPVPRRG